MAPTRADRFLEEFLDDESYSDLIGLRGRGAEFRAMTWRTRTKAGPACSPSSAISVIHDGMPGPDVGRVSGNVARASDGASASTV